MAIDKNNILTRYGIVIFLIVFVIFLIFRNIITIMFVDGAKWKSLGNEGKIENISIEPTRGNIYAYDGRLMASSIPQYLLFFDFKADGYVSKVNSQDSLLKYLTPLCVSLSSIIGDKSVAEYKSLILKGLHKKSRQFQISTKKVSYLDLKRLKETPFLKLRSGVSGFFTKSYFQRKKPFGSLASRTIGDIYSERYKGGKNGLELQFDSILEGTAGLAFSQKVRLNYIKFITKDPTDGMDIFTTIDVDIQDITEKALVDKLVELDAHSGTVVLMDVATGEVKAITNMQRTTTGVYTEARNAAVSDLSEPGSTFKVASMMVALDDNKVKPSDTIFAENGFWKYRGSVVKDHNWDKGGYGNISAAQAIWYSSNIGVAKIIDKAYRKCPSRFVDKLYQIGLNKKLDFQIPGAAKPYIKYPTSKLWSNTTLAWMSFGYETQIPPIYTLAFFNAIANNGVMIKPHFVKSIKRNGTEIEKFETEVVNPAICKPKTLSIIKEMLEGVVEKGTGTAIKSKNIKIAGKTGTAQVSQGGAGYSGHLVTFCGYFPSDKPRYSAIVVIRYPSPKFHASGGTMSGVVFKRIAEQVYARSLRIPAKEAPKDTVSPMLPTVKVALKKDVVSILSSLNLKAINMDASSGYVFSEHSSTGIILKKAEVDKHLIPSVVGMGIRDAVYLLENRGLRVTIVGCGTVFSQIPLAGKTYNKGETVKILLK